MPRNNISRRALGTAAVGSAIGGIILALPQPAAFGEVAAGPLAQATAVSPQLSPQPTPGPQATPGAKREVRFYPVDPQFLPYYNSVDGPRTLGGAISPVTTTSDGVPAQYFEKARLENRRAQNRTGNPAYDFEYGLLVDEMKAVRSPQAVGGDKSSVTYATIQDASDPTKRQAPPAGFTGNTLVMANGSVFVPFTADLSPAPGNVIPPFFWEFINRQDLFPGGWLHDVGLPITGAITANVDKGRIIGSDVQRVTNVPITVQAFQRTILTYDPANPAGYLTERANTGTDFMAVFPERVPQ